MVSLYAHKTPDAVDLDLYPVRIIRIGWLHMAQVRLVRHLLVTCMDYVYIQMIGYR